MYSVISVYNFINNILYNTRKHTPKQKLKVRDRKSKIRDMKK